MAAFARVASNVEIIGAWMAYKTARRCAVDLCDHVSLYVADFIQYAWRVRRFAGDEHRRVCNSERHTQVYCEDALL